MSEVSAYTDVVAPRLLEPWAEVLADALRPMTASTVVDVATGAGTVARAVARRLGLIGKVFACDTDPALLAAACATPAEAGAAPIVYTCAAPDALPYPDGIASGVTCQQHLVSSPDPTGTLLEMRRVSAPGARLVLATWRQPGDSPVFEALWTAATEHFGTDEADDVARWSGNDPELLSESARRSGWRDIDVLELDLPIEFEGGPAEVVGVLSITRLRERLAALDADMRAELVRRTAESLGSLVERDGAVRSRTGAHFLIARAP